MDDGEEDAALILAIISPLIRVAALISADEQELFDYYDRKPSGVDIKNDVADMRRYADLMRDLGRADVIRDDVRDRVEKLRHRYPESFGE